MDLNSGQTLWQRPCFLSDFTWGFLSYSFKTDVRSRKGSVFKLTEVAQLYEYELVSIQIQTEKYHLDSNSSFALQSNKSEKENVQDTLVISLLQGKKVPKITFKGIALFTSKPSHKYYTWTKNQKQRSLEVLPWIITEQNAAESATYPWDMLGLLWEKPGSESPRISALISQFKTQEASKRLSSYPLLHTILKPIPNYSWPQTWDCLHLSVFPPFTTGQWKREKIWRSSPHSWELIKS